jgi:hypothetical protein
MANPTYQLIASNTVGSGGVASVTFSSIPQVYTDLVVKVSARITSGNSTAVQYTYNGSSSGYSGKVVYGDASSAASTTGATSSNDLFLTDASSQYTNTFSSQEIYIPNYTNSNFKSSSMDSVEEDNTIYTYRALIASLWSNTSAITSITFTPSSSTFSQYSSFSLYGIRNY